jgi:hypothetical protein
MFTIAMGMVNLFLSAANVWVASGDFNYGVAVLAFGTFLFTMFTEKDN